MKRFSTDRLLTIGMALTGDKQAMERRVRGVFARKTSARTAKFGALALALLLGVACFTTACQPQTTPASNGNAALTSDGNAALASAGDAAVSAGDAVSIDRSASMLASRRALARSLQIRLGRAICRRSCRLWRSVGPSQRPILRRSADCCRPDPAS